MEKDAKTDDDRNRPIQAELLKNAKDDPELTVQLEAAQRVIEQYRDTLQRLADS
jgi:hypothetical protein